MQILPKKIFVKNKDKGIEKAKELIYKSSSFDTVLFLSGGSTPKPLYETLARDKKLQIGAVGMVDERFGEKMHENSNEKMIAETGLKDCLDDQNIRFYGVLKNKEIDETAENYDETARWLLYHFNRSIGILGIGADGHIAGIAPNRKDFINPMFDRESQKLFADYFDDSKGLFKKRVTMTFLSLSMLDQIIVLAFGKEKKKALQKMFTEGSKEEIPVRFLAQKGIAEKTIVITDQKV